MHKRKSDRMTRKKSKTPKSHPSAFADSLERFKSLVQPNLLPELLAELKRPLPSAIRVNLLKSSQEDATKWSKRYSWELTPIPFCKSGFVVQKASSSISQTIEHKMGNYYIQDAASMLPVELFDFSSSPHPLFLDMAASPGGKTTQIISNSMDRGLVIANDPNQGRIPALHSVLQNWSAANIAITQFPGEKFGSWFPETFDMILLDAPCSMEGLRATDAHLLRSISTNERSRLSQRQFSLLESAVISAKLGGQIVYSTCTLAPEEDEIVLDRLLEKHPECVRIEKIPTSLHVKAPALSQYQDIVFDPQVTHAVRLWPHLFGTAGFFAAKLIKVNSISSPSSPPPTVDIEKSGYGKMDSKGSHSFSDYLKNQYGFDFQDWEDSQDLHLFQKGNKVFAIPLLYQNPGINLPFQTLGMVIAEVNPDGWQISHEYCSRFGKDFTSGKITLPEEKVASWLCGEDQFGAVPAKSGNPIVVVCDADGRNLGRGKILSDRLKNLLPRRLI
jgi:16S rRNA (cytosine1407-C5)-methyltransferase